MKFRLHRIEIRNFKAFREFALNLEGRHLLVYGGNGSGKSSLYWALYTFLQSAGKQPKGSISKYFEPGGRESLLNFHEQATTTPKPGEIALTVRDTDTKTDTTYRINEIDHGTHNEPAILKADLASDFITYRFFFGFSNFKNSERFDLWRLFEMEILPFCVRPGASQTPFQQWKNICSEIANPDGIRGVGGADAYAQFKKGTEQFAVTLESVVGDISRKAQEFYDEHFANDDPAPVLLVLGLTRAPSFSGTNRQNSQFRKPILELHLKIGNEIIKRPQSFLNEAKMTQVALSVRLAASLVNLQEDEQNYFKLLVLDDLLVSLDMSNRMKVVEILLSDTFSNYQKIILTHELGFFREFRRKLGASHPAWCFLRLEGTPKANIVCKTQKTDIQKAEEYLHGHNLDEAALCLRKACEDTAKRFIDHDEVIATKNFVGLADSLRAARNKILGELPVKFYEKVLRNTPDAHRSLLVATNDDDIDANAALDKPAKGRLKINRERLRRIVAVEHVERLRQIKLIDDILACTERVLNPAAHSGSPPLYEKEVQDALDLINKLESSLTT
jgi:ABC-type Mn2+/Zn2+ transport system ATPase subunit